MVYCSGSVGIDPATGKLVDGDVKARTVGKFLSFLSFSIQFFAVEIASEV